jgi:hypothetical protein
MDKDREHGHGQGTDTDLDWNSFVEYLYGATVHIASYGFPETHTDASSNCAINLLRRFLLDLLSKRCVSGIVNISMKLSVHTVLFFDKRRLLLTISSTPLHGLRKRNSVSYAISENRSAGKNRTFATEPDVPSAKDALKLCMTLGRRKKTLVRCAS